ncbi:DUF1643 domain-containing protein [Microbacterium sp. CFBP 8790]|nr:DUF1643 domain-containing protein [Microbacterium sp. CFBP 8801]MBD8508735.1 DUF1643 domain-containing protein [Microbacterium sp. CFBP 8790]
MLGTNLSTAVSNALDPTLKRVPRFAVDNGYDSSTMLDFHSQIATDPKGLGRANRPEPHVEKKASD